MGEIVMSETLYPNGEFQEDSWSLDPDREPSRSNDTFAVESNNRVPEKLHSLQESDRAVDRVLAKVARNIAGKCQKANILLKIPKK